MRRPLDPTGRNERLTATIAAVLLVLLAVEGLTILSVRQLLSVHIVVGLLLIPPVALKLASTGYRFLRYYMRDAAFVAKGPPHIAMRLLAPLLVVSTATVLGTGVALLVLGPQNHRDVVLGLHKASFVVWFFVTSVHVLVYAPRLPRLVFSRARPAGVRLGVVAGSLVVGVALAGSAYSLARPWLHRAREQGNEDAAGAPVVRYASSPRIAAATSATARSTSGLSSSPVSKLAPSIP